MPTTPKKIPELTQISTPTAGDESDIQTVVARQSTFGNFKMTLAQIFTLATTSGSVKTALDGLSALIAGNTSSITSLGTTKLNKVGETRTGLTANRVIATNGSGQEITVGGSAGQVLGFGVGGEVISFNSPTDIESVSRVPNRVQSLACGNITKGDPVYITPSSKIAKAMEVSDTISGTAGYIYTSGTNISVVLSDTTFVSLGVMGGASNERGIITSSIGTFNTSGYTYSDNKVLRDDAPGGFGFTQFGVTCTQVSNDSFLLSRRYKWSNSGTSFIYIYLAKIVGGSLSLYSEQAIASGVGDITATSQALLTPSTFLVFYGYGSNFANIGSISGNTISMGSAVSTSESYGSSCSISNNNVLACSGSLVRIFSWNGTTIVQGNSLSLGATYTSYSITNIGGGRSLFVGTNSGSTYMSVIDANSTTPTKGLTYLVSAGTHINTVWNTVNGYGISTIGSVVYKITINGTIISTKAIHTKKIASSTINNPLNDYIIVSSFASGNSNQFSTYLTTPSKVVGVSDDNYADGVVANFISSGVLDGLAGVSPGDTYTKNGSSIGVGLTSTKIVI